ncbi:hypothetical protein BB560_002082 [Smittium megazygosporum]|uniref:Uncharacterized protein n=1 Tax=Smittium megazygosporum TaxID=133381 RepID=A0A2T9ZFR5_9FUNG|nr:hypothetical protein BB560_002080 [Smittium megazygosporum]PVV03428.1 hypothetical protein BB560_002082 [Smittium megazygosporum]
MKTTLYNSNLSQNGLQSEPFNFDYEIHPDIQQPMEFKPSDTTVQENYIDEYFVEPRGLIPSSKLLQLLPEIKKNCSRSALDRKKRTFMAQHPRSVQTQYYPSQISNFKLLQNFNQLDAQFASIQYKFSGIARSIDYYAHQLRISNAYKYLGIDEKQYINNISTD